MLEDLRRLVEPATLGDPMRPLLWVSKSREKLAAALRAMNHAISANTVGKMLVALGYSRQLNRKTKEGSHHPDRDGQFQHINRQKCIGGISCNPSRPTLLSSRWTEFLLTSSPD